jgi:hypothetical protein
MDRNGLPPICVELEAGEALPNPDTCERIVAYGWPQAFAGTGMSR